MNSLTRTRLSRFFLFSGGRHWSCDRDQGGWIRLVSLNKVSLWSKDTQFLTSQHICKILAPCVCMCVCVYVSFSVPVFCPCLSVCVCVDTEYSRDWSLEARFNFYRPLIGSHCPHLLPLEISEEKIQSQNLFAKKCRWETFQLTNGKCKKRLLASPGRQCFSHFCVFSICSSLSLSMIFILIFNLFFLYLWLSQFLAIPEAGRTFFRGDKVPCAHHTITPTHKNQVQIMQISNTNNTPYKYKYKYNHTRTPARKNQVQIMQNSNTNTTPYKHKYSYKQTRTPACNNQIQITQNSHAELFPNGNTKSRKHLDRTIEYKSCRLLAIGNYK